MATFVLVHGMWHGGWCWKKVAPFLRGAGHEVFTPTLTGLGERKHLHLPDIEFSLHVQDIVAVLEYEDIHDGILVGHSYGGTMLLSIAEQCVGRLTHLVNLDGPLPIDGQSLKDLIPDMWDLFRQQARAHGDTWWVPAPSDWTFGVIGADLEWMRSKLTAHPLQTWLTPITCANPQALALPRTYIGCTGKKTPDRIIADQQNYLQRGWQYRQLATGHDAMITEPQALAKLLLDCL